MTLRERMRLLVHCLHEDAKVQQSMGFDEESKARAHKVAANIRAERDAICEEFDIPNPAACTECGTIGRFVHNLNQWQVGVRECASCGHKGGENGSFHTPPLFWDAETAR